MPSDGDLDGRLAALAARVALLERTLEAMRSSPAMAMDQADRSPAPLPRPHPGADSAPEAAAGRRSQSLESRIGSQFLNRIGIIAMLIGAAWFLRLAFGRNWIGPAVRILIGLASAAVMVAWLERFRRHGFAAFSYTLKALGTGIGYLSLWAAASVYRLLPPGAGFLAMTALTAVNAVGSTAGKPVYTRNRRRAKRLIPVKERITMRLMNAFLAGVLVIALIGVVKVGRSQDTSPGKSPANPFGSSAPPTDKIRVWHEAAIDAAIKENNPHVNMLMGGNLYQMTLLHRIPEPATVHKSVVDLYVVEEGSGTMETGGTLLNPTPHGRGDSYGSGISGGHKTPIKKGDIVFVPPGVPHHFVGSSDIWYLNTHFPGK